jgi:protein SCO1/2
VTARGFALGCCTLVSAALVSGCAAGPGDQATNPAGVLISTPVNSSGFDGSVVPRPYHMPDLTLTDTTGHALDLRQATSTPVTLVFFGYTNCPDICSLVMADIATAVSRLDPSVASDVRMLFITTDPARDTPEVLRSYLDRFNPDFEGLTGPISSIRRVATALGVAIAGVKRLPGGGYDVAHGSQIIGFDQAGDISVVWTEGTPVSDLAHDIVLLDQRS